MRALSRASSPALSNTRATTSAQSPGQSLIRIDNATFYRNHPSTAARNAPSNPPIFPGLTFSLPAFPSSPQCWSILGPSSSGKTTFLDLLRGQHLCFPPLARSYPYLSSDEISAKDHRLRTPTHAIQYVGFNGERGGIGGPGTRGAYLSARFESRREKTDYSLSDYLKGNTDLNPLEDQESRGPEDETFNEVVKSLRLEGLIEMPVGNLSNGQTRRARIARALLSKPELLLLDEPFMGLDPPTLITLLPILHGLAKANSPRLILALRPQDPLPEWITHLIYLGSGMRVAHQGLKEAVLDKVKHQHRNTLQRSHRNNHQLPNESPHEIKLNAISTGTQDDVVSEETLKFRTPENMKHDSRPRDLESESVFESQSQTILTVKIARFDEASEKHDRPEGAKKPSIVLEPPRRVQLFSREGLPLIEENFLKTGEPVVEMEGVHVKYGEKYILGNWKKVIDGLSVDGLWWNVRKGERWGIFGPNGSGKTTILSLISSDHPQTYSLPIKLFGRSRLPQKGQPGISIFDLQARIGHSSPEIHAFFPRRLTLRQTVENAWADTFLSTPLLNSFRNGLVESCLRWFESELCPSSKATAKGDERFMGVPNTDLDWSNQLRFGDVPFSSQRVALLLRAIVKKPDLLILDEAFSGMDDSIRDKCMLFLTWGEARSFDYVTDNSNDNKPRKKICERKPNQVFVGGLTNEQALICVSHVKEEVPGLVRKWMCLPEANEGTAARFGHLDGPLEGDPHGWNRIWGV